MTDNEFHYEFESDEGFMRFLRDLDPERPDWWECEYSGNLRNMYAAYQAGKRDNLSSVRYVISVLPDGPEFYYRFDDLK